MKKPIGIIHLEYDEDAPYRITAPRIMARQVGACSKAKLPLSPHCATLDDFLHNCDRLIADLENLKLAAPGYYARIAATPEHKRLVRKGFESDPEPHLSKWRKFAVASCGDFYQEVAELWGYLATFGTDEGGRPCITSLCRNEGEWRAQMNLLRHQVDGLEEEGLELLRRARELKQ